jgi:hypothetical protein
LQKAFLPETNLNETEVPPVFTWLLILCVLPAISRGFSAGLTRHARERRRKEEAGQRAVLSSMEAKLQLFVLLQQRPAA